GDDLVHSTLETYIDAVKSSIEGMQIPLISGELRSPKKHHLLPGVLSTRMWIKQQNYTCETLLEKWAEPFSTLNQILDQGLDGRFIQNPSDFLHQSWKLLMQNHPHDSICGCSIDQVHDEMKTRFDQVEQIGEEITLQSLTQLSSKVNTRKKIPEDIVSALIIFNANSFTRTDLVNCDLNIPSDIHSFKLVDLDGNQIPFQTSGANSSELINMKLDKDGLKGIIGSIHEGKIGNLSIQSLEYEKEDEETLSIITELAENRPVNQTVWENATKAILQFIQDPSVKFFHVRAFDPKKVNISFCVSDVPPLGWKTIFVQSEPDRITLETKINWITRLLSPLMIRLINTDTGKKLLDKFSNNESKPPFKIENEFFVVELNQFGTLDVLDKRNAKRYRNLNQFMDGGDSGDEYNYCPPQQDRLIQAKLVNRSVNRGNICDTLEAELIINAPAELTADRKSRGRNEKTLSIHSTVQLIRNVPRIDISTSINNTAKDHRLRVHFPIKVENENQPPDKATHDGHFDVIERQIGIPEFDSSWAEDPRPEVPQRAFSDVSTGESGLMVANLGLPEVEIFNGEGQSELILTLIRSVGWLSRDDFQNRKGHAGPFLPTPKAQMEGKWQFDYSIIPHAGKWNTNQNPGLPYQLAYGFNSPMRVVETSIHDGELSSTGSFVNVTPEEFIISSIKQTSGRDSWIIRGYNLSDKEIMVKLSLWKNFSVVVYSNLIEESLEEINPDVDGKYKIPVLPHQILTIKLSNN
ncbi:MAG: glycosyl hydrolase-related protein, partial [Anaerolineales bacterium]